MAAVDTIEIAYNIRIFIQLSAKQQSIYNRVIQQIVTPNEREPKRPQINNLNTVQLPVSDIKAKKDSRTKTVLRKIEKGQDITKINIKYRYK